MISGNRFLVTGGLGFIGSHICEELVNQGKDVVCVDDLTSGTFDNAVGWWNSNCEFYDYDVATAPDDFFSEIFEGVDVVFHEACSKCTVCRDDPYRDLMTNAWGSFRVFREAARVGAKVVHASTGSVYGDCLTQHEGQQYAPKSFYGVSKLAGEQYLRAFSEYHGLRWTGLRYFHVYGPRQSDSDKGGVIPIFLRNISENRPLTIYGDGEQVRSFTYVKDVVAANLMAAEDPSMDGRYFNVASGLRVSLNTLVCVMRSLFGESFPVNYEPERKGDIKYFDVRCRLDIKWTPLVEGLKQTMRQYKEVG